MTSALSYPMDLDRIAANVVLHILFIYFTNINPGSTTETTWMAAAWNLNTNTLDALYFMKMKKQNGHFNKTVPYATQNRLKIIVIFVHMLDN